MGYNVVECKNLPRNSIPTHDNSNLNQFDKLSYEDKKTLVDSLIDPIFVVSNANEFLKKKLEIFVDEETREHFYMIERSQKRIKETIDQLRKSPLWCVVDINIYQNLALLSMPDSEPHVVGIEILKKNGVNIDELIEQLVINSSVEFTAYY